MLDRYFGRWFDVRRATGEQQRKGIDRLLTGLLHGQTITMEYKADWTASSTGNAFIELECNNKPGWAAKSTATYIVYLLPSDGRLWVLPTDVLQMSLEQWEPKYPTHRVHNNGYSAAGLLVPLSKLNDIAVQATVINMEELLHAQNHRAGNEVLSGPV